MTKIFPMILRALLLVTIIYSLNVIAAETSPAGENPVTDSNSGVTQLAAPTQATATAPNPSAVSAFPNIPPEILANISSSDLADLLHMQMKKPESAVEVIFNKQIIVPGMVFGSFAAIAFFIAYFSYRKRRELLLLVHEAVKSGHPLPENFMETLEYKRKPTAESDLRKSMILIALGLSSTVIIFFVAEGQDRSMAALGVLPFLVGLAYLFLWKNAQPKDVNASKRID